MSSTHLFTQTQMYTFLKSTKIHPFNRVTKSLKNLTLKYRHVFVDPFSFIAVLVHTIGIVVTSGVCIIIFNFLMFGINLKIPNIKKQIKGNLTITLQLFSALNRSSSRGTPIFFRIPICKPYCNSFALNVFTNEGHDQ